MMVNKLISICSHLLGCCGAGSSQTWQEACQWAICPTVKLAATARSGFQSSPPLAPSAPPPPDVDPLDFQVGGVEAPVGSTSKPFLNKWKMKRNRKKSQAPVAPGLTEQSRTGHLRPTPGAVAPLRPPVTGLRGLPPVKTPAHPPSKRRSSSTPRKSSRQEEVEILLPAHIPSNDILDSYRDVFA